LRWIMPLTESLDLDWALSEPYDAAVVDIMLPGLDGLSLIGRCDGRK
jgi:DNA-binding response OmpR family regulator